MSFIQRIPDDPELRNLARVKQTILPPFPALGPDVLSFFKHNIQKRQAKFGEVSETWAKLVPELLLEHTALDSFNKGQLTVMVDSAAHLYELRQLLLAGLQKQIIVACKAAGLRKINLKFGRWYDSPGNHPADRRVRF